MYLKAPLKCGHPSVQNNFVGTQFNVLKHPECSEGPGHFPKVSAFNYNVCTWLMKRPEQYRCFVKTRTPLL